MTKKEKELLLVDLCARLPYRQICVYKESSYEILGCLLNKVNISKPILSEIKWINIEDCRPYLRPISSMTKEEKEELRQISEVYLDDWSTADSNLLKWKLDAKASSMSAVFYNSHHLDWNGLIEKGLAIEAPEDMYKKGE